MQPSSLLGVVKSEGMCIVAVSLNERLCRTVISESETTCRSTCPSFYLTALPRQELWVERTIDWTPDLHEERFARAETLLLESFFAGFSF
jgi:hypothetical protein